MFKFIKKHKILFIILIIIMAGVVWQVFIKKEAKTEPQFVTAERGAIIQEVDVTGRVKPASEVDLAFLKSGKVSAIPVKIGSRVTAGTLLVSLENNDLKAQLLEAQANLDSEKSKLNELKTGTRPEEIQIAKTTVANAKTTLEDAEKNLLQVEAKAAADLDSVYQSAITTAADSITVAKNTLLKITDLQTSYFSGQDQDEVALAQAKEAAVLALLGAQNAGRWSTSTLSSLHDGATLKVSDALITGDHNQIDEALIAAADAIQKIKNMVDIVPITTSLSGTDKTTIDTEKTNMAAEVTAISTKRQALAVQKATNASTISTAESSINTARNTLMSAENNLTLKQAGNTLEQITTEEARVKSYEAVVGQTQAELAKTVLYAPISGVVTAKETKLGEIVSANTTIISIISDNQLEVETNIPEADIAKIKIKDPAVVTLDAYGKEVEFEAEVISIDPAETLIEGVATYKVTLQFKKEDERIKSGMTANIVVLTDQRENVITIPQRAITTIDGEKTVRVLSEGGTINEITVTTGLRGSDGNIEILKGLTEGDRVVVFVKE